MPLQNMPLDFSASTYVFGFGTALDLTLDGVTGLQYLENTLLQLLEL
jgi:hypothetical protein